MAGTVVLKIMILGSRGGFVMAASSLLTKEPITCAPDTILMMIQHKSCVIVDECRETKVGHY